MSISPAEIERIVREVLAQYGVLPQGGPSTSPVSTVAAGRPAVVAPVASPSQAKPKEAIAVAGPAAVPTTRPGDFTVRRRVVTVDDLPSRWDGIRRFVVPPRAVLTPSVRDALLARRVEIVFEQAAAATSGREAVFLFAAGSSVDPAGLVRALEGDGYAVATERGSCLIVASERLEAELRSGSSPAVLLTKHPAPAVCLANRRAGVRAVRATSVEATAKDADAVGANLLVVDPTEHGFFAMRQLVRRFLRGGLRACPEALRGPLG